MRGKRLAAALLCATAGLGTGASIGAATPPPVDEKTGGDTTVFATGRNAFSFPAANLSDEERTRFVIGNSFFKRNWVEAPASTTACDGLGPHFIARSCGGCHVTDGRGPPPQIGNRLKGPDPAVALLMRLSVPGNADPKTGVVPEPMYGDQFNNAAVQGVKPEGEVVIRHTPVAGRFADGTRYTLQKPAYSFSNLGYGPLHSKVMIGTRIAPQLVGMGLLEAIAEADILGNATRQAATPGLVKGQANRVWDAFAGREMTSRFGWKANVATVAHQTAGAFREDMGITSSRAPEENCSAAQADCLKAPHGAQGECPEIDDKTLGDVVFYQATLAPPAWRNPNERQTVRGQQQVLKMSKGERDALVKFVESL